MKLLLIAASLLMTLYVRAQTDSVTIPCNSNTIIVKGVKFLQVCNVLLDAGYVIDKKDNDLQTVTTKPMDFPKYWNATYRINARIQDSTASFTCDIFMLGIGTGDRVHYDCKKNGKPWPKSTYTYPFTLMNDFAKSLNKPISYSIK